MDQEIKEIKTKLEEQALKIDAIYNSVEKSRKYFLVTMWVTVIVIVVPIIGLAFIAPSFVASYSNILGGGQ